MAGRTSRSVGRAERKGDDISDIATSVMLDPDTGEPHREPDGGPYVITFQGPGKPVLVNGREVPPAPQGLGSTKPSSKPGEG